MATDEPDGPDESRKYAWIDRVARIGEALGANPVRIRWRLMRWQDRRESDREAASVRAAHVRYAHAVCPRCGRVQPRSNRLCSGPTCGVPLGSQLGQLLRRVGLMTGVSLSATSVLLGLIVIAYAKQVVASNGTFLVFDGQLLLALGAHWPPLERAGEWWRLGTAAFLHGHIIHVGFNVLALSQIGPPIEELFGRGRAALVFVGTALVAFVPGLLMDQNAMSVGASGGVMGLIGAAAGWGHRDGTSIGLGVRNQMLKWLLYTTLFGLFMRADHLAHFAGFGVGAVLGLTFRPRQRGEVGGTLDVVMGVAAAAVAVTCVALIWTRRVG